MYLSVLIVNWNSKDYLRRCLHTIRETCAEFRPQIVVVDAASFDGSKGMIDEEFPEVEFIQCQENLGFARSNNIGFKRVRGEYLLLLNPDTELKKHAVENLLDVFRKHPDIGIAGPRILNTDGSLQTSCVQALPTPINQAVDSEFLRRLFPKSNLWGVWEAFRATEPCEVEAISGACMLLKSQTFRELGGFCPDYFMYAEDMDLCYRVKRMGLKIYHVPSAVIIHHGGGSSTKQPNDFSIVAMREANYIYFIKNQGFLSAKLYVILQCFSAFMRLGIMLPVFVLSKYYRGESMRYSFLKWKIILRWAIKKIELGSSKSHLDFLLK